MAHKWFRLNSSSMERAHIQLDAKGQAPGRLASQIAMILIGKHKPTYTPHLDEGDFVEVSNVAEMVIKGTGKLTTKKYYKHTGYVGNMKIRTLGEVMRDNPREVLKMAVDKMLPKNRLRSERLRRLIIK